MPLLRLCFPPSVCECEWHRINKQTNQTGMGILRAHKEPHRAIKNNMTIKEIENSESHAIFPIAPFPRNKVEMQ